MLCVPHITKNLLSISKFTRDNNVIVEFFADHCVVKDKHSKIILLQGELKAGLYQLQVPATSPHSITNASVHSFSPASKIASVSSYVGSSNKCSSNSSLQQSVLSTSLSSCNDKNQTKSHDTVLHCTGNVDEKLPAFVSTCTDATIVNKKCDFQSFPA